MQYLCFEVLGVDLVIEDFNKMEKDSSLFLNGVLFGYLSLKVGGEEVERGEMSGHVDTEKLEESVDVAAVSFAVD